MKITVFNGSSRGKTGNTALMVKEFLKGAESAGAETENIFLVDRKIHHCMGCFDCWFKSPGECIIKNDDMKELLVKFIQSDIVVMATPLYVDNVSGIMKNFMDRFLPLIDPRFEKDEEGEYRHIKRFSKYPKIVVISNCGFPEQSHFQVLKLLFRRIARNMHSEVIAEIYRGEGEILKYDLLILRIFIDRYKKLLRTAGREVAENMKLSEETKERLEKPLIPLERYAKGANKNAEKQLTGHRKK